MCAEQQTRLAGTGTVIRDQTRDGMVSDSDKCAAGRKRANMTVATVAALRWPGEASLRR